MHGRTLALGSQQARQRKMMGFYAWHLVGKMMPKELLSPGCTV